MGKNLAIIGAGNTAMDACRVGLRMGAESVKLVYRRTIKESPARAEELHHAIEEGVDCRWLTNPVEILGNDDGWVTGMKVITMELGEPDDSGRRRPVPVEGSEHLLDVDMVIYALGTSANPVIAQTTPGLNINKWGYIEIDEATGRSRSESRLIEVLTKKPVRPTTAEVAANPRARSARLRAARRL